MATDISEWEPIAATPSASEWGPITPVAASRQGAGLSGVKLSPIQTAQLQTGTRDPSTESFSSWLPRQPVLPTETIGPMSTWDRLTQSARIGLEKAFPGMKEKGSPSPVDVVAQAAMIAPLGMPESLAKPLMAYFAARTAAEQPAAIGQIKDELQRGDYSAAQKTAIEDALQLGLVGTGVMGLRGEHQLPIPKPSPPPPNARSIQTPAEIHGDVSPQPVSREGQMPAQESDRGIQPQTQTRLPQPASGDVPLTGAPASSTAEPSLTPALLINGKPVTGGKNHQAIMESLQGGDAATAEAAILANADDSKHVFVDKAGNILTRGQAAKVFDEQKGNPPGTTKELHSEDLVELNQPKTIPQDWRVVVSSEQTKPETGEKIPGYYQIVDPEGNEAGGAKTPEQLRTAGYDIPDFSKLPTGRYTFDEAKKMLATQSKATATSPENKPPMVEGLGAAKVGEVGSQPGADIYGVATRVREQRAQAGQVAEVPPGQGISAADSVEHGRELLTKGLNPEQVVFSYEKTKALSAGDMAVVRAHGEKLALEARRTEEKFGTDSPEYRAAWKTLSDWDTRIKPMQTEWHKIGMAQQGETDIDTGTFTGLQRAYKADTGKDFTPSQADTAKQITRKVKNAGYEAENAKQKLSQQLNKEFGSETAQPDAEKQALDAAHKTVREAGARLAENENKIRVADTVRKTETEKIQKLAKDKALTAAGKTVREAAIRQAKAEGKQRITQAARDKHTAQVQLAAERKALDAANKAVRDAAVRAAQAETDARVNPEKKVWEKVKQYLDTGELDFDEIRNRVATDLGMPVEKVTRLLTQSKRTKYLADDVWKKQQALRRFNEQAKRWLKQTAMPGYQRAIASVPRILFGLKVGFHGTVALGTHAPTVAFQPRFWNAYVRDFVKMYRMVGSPAYYEMQVQDLLRRPNYTIARRAGLVNDPFQAEDYNSPDIAQYVGRLSGMGNRGYSVLKILRQDMFDQHWNALPQTTRIPEVAQAIADGVNHATGVVKGMAPKGANLVLFAPRLEASRVAWLVADPVKTVDTFYRWKTASEAEKNFAINQVKEKAWVAGTLFGLLALNQGILMATDSKQKINFTDPMHSDWLKFKVAGMNLSYGNAMLSMARLPVRLYQIRTSDGGKLKNLIYPDEDTYSVMGQYARSQLSPFASLASTLWLKGDWENRPLPDSKRPIPKRLAAQGVKPYTWPEFWAEQVAPIPAEEAMREEWQLGLGMSPEQVKNMYKAMATITVMAATGARLTGDVPANPQATATFRPPSSANAPE